MPNFVFRYEYIFYVSILMCGPLQTVVIPFLKWTPELKPIFLSITLFLHGCYDYAVGVPWPWSSHCCTTLFILMFLYFRGYWLRTTYHLFRFDLDICIKNFSIWFSFLVVEWDHFEFIHSVSFKVLNTLSNIWRHLYIQNTNGLMFHAQNYILQKKNNQGNECSFFSASNLFMDL